MREKHRHSFWYIGKDPLCETHTHLSSFFSFLFSSQQHSVNSEFKIFSQEHVSTTKSVILQNAYRKCFPQFYFGSVIGKVINLLGNFLCSLSEILSGDNRVVTYFTKILLDWDFFWKVVHFLFGSVFCFIKTWVLKFL